MKKLLYLLMYFLIIMPVNIMAMTYSKTLASELKYAIKNGIPELVRDILSTGQVDVNKTYKATVTFANKKKMRTNIDLLKLLILQQHSQEVSCAIAQLLIEHGINILQRNAIGGTSIAWAAFCCKQRLFNLLKKHVPIDALQEGLHYALIVAIMENNLEIVQFVLDQQSIDLDVFDLATKKTSLMAAVIKNQEAIVDMLLNAGARIDVCNPSGATALHFACVGGFKNLIKLLIAKGALIEKKTSKGVTPCMLAAKNGHYESTWLLLSAGADPNQIDIGGNTALHHAAAADALTTLQLLIEHDAHVNARNNEGFTPLNMAARYGCANTFEALLAYDAHMYVPDIYDQLGLLHNAAYGGNIKIISLLMQHDFQVDATYEGLTPLMLAVAGDNKDAVKFLIDKAADVNICEVYSERSALHYAVDRGNQDILTMLINAGGNIHIADHKGYTPLMTAVCYKAYPCVRTLLNVGANINAQDMDGNTSLMLAIKNNDFPMIQLLDEYGADLFITNNDNQSALDFLVQKCIRYKQLLSAYRH